MAIKFGTDGTIYCNTVRYNWKQARNMIADGSYGNISTSSVWVGVSASTNPGGYRSYRSFKIATDGTRTQQALPTLYASHKYYLSARVYGNGNSLNSAIQIRDSSGNVIYSLSQYGSSFTTWVLQSGRFTPTANVSGGNISMYGYTNNTYVSSLILVDLTDTFGSGNEPSKAWCDSNIREHETLCNMGNITTAVKYSNYNSAYTFANWNSVNYYNYLQLDSNWEPREYMWYMSSNTSYSEAFINSTVNGNLANNTYKYYGYLEAYTTYKPTNPSFEVYFPVAEPTMGIQQIVTESDFNGGGGMKNWKRLSDFADRTSFTSGSYAQRFDYNHWNGGGNVRCTALNIMNVNTNMKYYNTYNGTSITISDVNKEWCDRWIDGRSSPIIHIKDPSNKKIKFSAPLQEMKRTSTTYYTKSQVDGWKNMSDSWGNISNASSLVIGQDAYLSFIRSDDNVQCRFRVRVDGVSGSTVTTYNYTYGVQGDATYELTNGYDIVCNDIEIRPELSKVVLDGTTGTIKCHKLVRTLSY